MTSLLAGRVKSVTRQWPDVYSWAALRAAPGLEKGVSNEGLCTIPSFLFLPFSSASLLTAWLPGLGPGGAGRPSAGERAELDARLSKPGVHRSARGWGSLTWTSAPLWQACVLVGERNASPHRADTFWLDNLPSSSHKRRGSTSGRRPRALPPPAPPPAEGLPGPGRGDLTAGGGRGRAAAAGAPPRWGEPGSAAGPVVPEGRLGAGVSLAEAPSSAVTSCGSRH